ncbi:MAG TPA: SGNH/GDSL hydrolase family protein, partial [Caldimonas sp.]|nr:SGNH/GDSL hydrolase family protein [Caldimonas sp.]
SGQFTNGDVWAKTFASALGVPLSAQPVPAGGGNYAFGGARVATDGAGLPPSLTTQEGLYLQSHGNSAPGSALYVIAGGGNDARDALAAAASAMNPGAVIAAAAMSFAQSIGVMVDQLQAAGAQHIVVWDVPDLGLAPAVTALGAGPTFLGTQVSLAMNGALASRLTGEAGVSVFDLFGLQNKIVANPASFGLLNVTDACGAPTAQCSPATSLYWDGIHPTAAGHAILAQGMLAVVAVPEPSELVLILAGLVAVATWRRRARR